MASERVTLQNEEDNNPDETETNGLYFNIKAIFNNQFIKDPKLKDVLSTIVLTYWALFLLPYSITNISSSSSQILLFSNIMVIIGCSLNYISIPRNNLFDDTISIRNLAATFLFLGAISMIIVSIHSNIYNINYFHISSSFSIFYIFLTILYRNENRLIFNKYFTRITRIILCIILSISLSVSFIIEISDYMNKNWIFCLNIIILSCITYINALINTITITFKYDKCVPFAKLLLIIWSCAVTTCAAFGIYEYVMQSAFNNFVIGDIGLALSNTILIIGVNLFVICEMLSRDIEQDYDYQIVSLTPDQLW